MIRWNFKLKVDITVTHDSYRNEELMKMPLSGLWDYINLL